MKLKKVNGKSLTIFGTREELLTETAGLHDSEFEHRKSVMERWIDFLVERGYYKILPGPKGGYLELGNKYRELLLASQDRVQSTIDDLSRGHPETDWADVAGLELARVIFEKERMEVSPKDFAELSGALRALIKLDSR